MGWLGWTLTFLALGLLALAVLGLLALRLWRAGKALGRDLAHASSQLADIGPAKYPSDAP
jgi:predicted MFS family arabinose efflux permease